MADPVSPTVTTPQTMKWWVTPSLGLYALTLFGIALIWVLYMGKDNYVMLMLGAVISLVNQGPWSFFFGSSASSQKKDETIATDSAAKSVALGLPGTVTPITTTTTTIPPAGPAAGPVVTTTKTEPQPADPLEAAIAATPKP